MVGRGRPRLPRQVEREFWREIALGLGTEDAAAAVGVSRAAGTRWFLDGGGMPTLELSEPAGRYLSMAEREEIAVLRSQVSAREIARRLGRSPATISRELRRNATGGSPARYRATVAQSEADRRARRPKAAKLAAYLPLHDYVADKLGGAEHWSPEQISRRIRMDFPDDERMRISHEAIYRALYVQGRGALRRELTASLRTGRALRKPRRRAEQRRERIKDKVMIADRPAEVADRAVPGHWEGDLIIGADSGSAIGTLVERTTRFTMLLHLPADHGAIAVRDAITTTIATLPTELARSLTWDQWYRAVRACPAHLRRRPPGVLLRPAQSVAAGHQREHQWPAAPVLPERNRPVRAQQRGSRPRRRRTQRSTPKDTRLEDPCRGSCRTTVQGSVNTPVLRRPVDSACMSCRRRSIRR